MSRVFWSVVAVLVLLWILLQAGAFAFSPTLHGIVAQIVYTAWGLACPLFFLTLFLAPGLYRDLTGGFSHAWRRIATRRRDVEDLQRKIAHLDKAHHMCQLGGHYLRQGNHRRAGEWFEKALAREPDNLEANYKLALCRFEQSDYAQASELLEKVHAEKPDHDYGMAYLRLAQSHQRLGHNERAEEIYGTLLKFYPGHPEGSYHYAMLEAQLGHLESARQLMRDMIQSVRLSPGFQRRRNRHWVLKAHWWLWRH